ncbi:MAG: hypothetical protein AB7P03_17050 [Kofleriaceae bacterium]
MKKLALGALFVGLVAACGGGGSKSDKNNNNDNNNDIMLIDSSTTPDAPVTAACNPNAQTGCQAGEKCTWITDQEEPNPIGHVGCVPDGTIAVGDACTEGPPGPMGYDQCVKGAVCIAGECKTICNTGGGDPMCDSNYSCERYSDLFEVGGTTIAGVCDPACDPLTQNLKDMDNSPACGSTNPAMPNKGCYGFDEYSCAPTGSASWPLTDRAVPRADNGIPYLNGCAPGFMPIFFEMTGSMKTLCSGLCAALESDNTKPAANAKGDAAALGKLPLEAAPVAGNATCAQGVKGSDQSSVCRFMWQYVLNDDGTLLPSFEMNYADTMGVCMAIAFFQYDSDGNMQPDTGYPNCKDLPPPSAGTPGNFDDANDWGCYKIGNSTFKSNSRTNNLNQDIRIGTMKSQMKMSRHQLL